MAWAARLTSFSDLGQLCRRYSDNFEVCRYDNGNKYYYMVEVIDGRKYHIKISNYNRAEGYNVLIKVFGPYPHVLNKVMDNLEAKLRMKKVRGPTPELVLLFDLINSMRKHNKNGKLIRKE